MFPKNDFALSKSGIINLKGGKLVGEKVAPISIGVSFLKVYFIGRMAVEKGEYLAV